MASIVKSLFGPLRIWIPFLVDVIFVSDPQQIKRIEGSGEVDRLHAYGTKALPFWIKTFFRATRFCDAERDLWFLSLESKKNSNYGQRYTSLQDKITSRPKPEDVETIADLLEANADDETLARAMTQIVNKRYFGEDVPRPVTRAAQHTLQDLPETVLPWKYFRARAAQKKIMAYCRQTLDGNAHHVDIGHNIGETVQTTTTALRRLYHNLDTPVDTIFTQHALTTQVPRIATKRTTFNGLLLFSTAPGKTVLIFRIKNAAAKSGNILFTFGAGVPERRCVFKDFFLDFMTDLQKALRDGAPKAPANR
jgi:hypothetical protein